MSEGDDDAQRGRAYACVVASILLPLLGQQLTSPCSFGIQVRQARRHADVRPGVRRRCAFY
jgi:hypothetical protein